MPIPLTLSSTLTPQTSPSTLTAPIPTTTHSKLYGDREYIILDKPHNIQGWELFANRLRRTNPKSSPHILFREFLAFNDFSSLDENIEDYLKFGGFPESYLFGREILDRYR